jgi:hypothetical protein
MASAHHMTTHTKDISSNSTIIRGHNSTADDYEGEIKLAIWEASRRRRSSKVRFDFDDEGVLECGRSTQRYAAALRDMAGALAFRNCNSVNVFPNALKTVTVQCR